MSLATQARWTNSATMNTWLHKAVIKKLSENGGKVPANLLY